MDDQNLGNRLLVIDDEPAIGRIITLVAEAAGFEVVFTSDPLSFTKTARFWRPSVILLDLKIPGTDGIQLLRTLASDNCKAHVVIHSGSDGKVIEAAMQLGDERGLTMAGMLQKPVRAETLRELLVGLLQMPKEQLAADLAAAISENQLYLEYQPKFSCAAARLTGVEALARWRHPRLGIIPPDEFIALAEESELIHRLTDWAVGSAARQAAAWRADGLDIAVAVNISARDLEDLDLPERLVQQVEAAGIDPDGIILELTETGAMRQAVQMMDVLTRLRLKGFRLSMDDFGTGYSSLVQLQRMPFSEVKIDRSFVAQMTTNQSCRTIVEIIIILAQKLGLKTVAEGVEDAAALKALSELGCDTAQGYHLGRPMPATGILAMHRDSEAAQLSSVA